VKKIHTLLALTLLVCLTACGGESADAGSASDDSAASTTAAAAAEAVDCAPLTVTIDGEPVAGLDHAFAYSEPESGAGTGGYGVDVFNHGDASCDDVLAGSRDVPEGEVNVRAFVQEASGRGSVAVGSKTNFAQGVELAKKPSGAGDTVAICVENVKWTAGGFSGNGPTYEINGLFSGEYCGERS
jgi:hypothetical protein